MKKIFVLAVFFSFLILPPGCFAQRVVVADNDLGAIYAQTGAIIVTFENITLQSVNLKPLVTNFSDFWIPDGPEKVLTGDAFFGLTDAVLIGGLVERSGTLKIQVFTDHDPPNPDDHFDYTEVPSRCRLVAEIHDLRINANIGFEATVKLGTKSDLTTWSSTGIQLPDQILGRTYTAGVSATINGTAQVYARYP
ncbi:MAG: hypothetical protein CVU55_07830 [Deltaproteobacteria bacterium HGW-Deltaproteobacteria-13]|nr:MAG: hypothetical protein CVU55_07830 [Deltaproteobacteria bacterium HGW-Deltaproteobacteria-13]